MALSRPLPGPLTRTSSFLDAELGGFFGGLLGGHLTGERRALAAPLEAAGAGTGPAERIALGVGDRHAGVVEGRLDVGDAHGHIPSRLASFAFRHRCPRLKSISVEAGNAQFAKFRVQRPLICRQADPGKPATRAQLARGWPPIAYYANPSRPSCRPRSSWVLCACGRWSGSAGRAPADRGDAECRDTADVLEPRDVLRDLPPQLPLDGVILVQQRRQPGDFVFVQVAGLGLRVRRRPCGTSRARSSDPRRTNTAARSPWADRWECRHPINAASKTVS